MAQVRSYTARTEGKNGEYVFSCPSSLNLSLAVWLIDDFTQKEPLGEIKVTLKGDNITTVKAVKNLSGFYTFSGLPKGKYTLKVESEIYFPEEKIVDTSSSRYPEEPESVILKPRPLYPFPDRATLVRGMLATAADSSLPSGITVEATSKSAEYTIQGIPDEKGEFVLYFREIVQRKADIDLIIKGKGTQKKSVSVEEGRSTYIGKI